MLSGPPTAPFYMYEGAQFPTPDALLACRGLKRLAPLDEPMAQFYAEKELHRALSAHPQRVRDPAQAALFYVPVLPHLDQDAGGCNGTGHRAAGLPAGSTLHAAGEPSPTGYRAGRLASGSARRTALSLV